MLGRFLGSALIALVLLTSCDTYLQLGDARLGLRLSEQGTPEVLYAACDRERVARINISIVHDNLGGEDDKVLWQIDAHPRWARVTLLSAIPGSTPPAGFSTSIELQGDLTADQEVVAAVWLKPDGFAYASSFRVGELRPNKILSDLGQQITMEEFLDAARDSCDGSISES